MGFWSASCFCLLVACKSRSACDDTIAETRYQRATSGVAVDAAESALPASPAPPTAGEPAFDHSFQLPSGAAAGVSCEAARKVVAQVRQNLPYVPEAVSASSFAKETTSWIDPYGYLAFESDTPVHALAEKHARALLDELERGAGPCREAQTIARALSDWVRVLRAEFERNSNMSVRVQPTGREQRDAALETLPDSGKTLPRVAILSQRYRDLPAGLRPYGAITRERLFPEQSEHDWESIVVASALRSWVPLLDAHSNWAPKDEKASVYDVDLDDLAGDRLFTKASPTMVGARIDEGPLAPLERDDIILKVGPLALGGLSPEQLGQVAVAALADQHSTTLVVYRAGRIITLEAMADTRPGRESPQTVSVEEINVDDRRIAIVAIHDIHDALGADLSQIIVDLNARANTLGIVLDLRGNGGGSMDGAIDALGHFLPGLPMFPMRAAQGEQVLPDFAPEPAVLQVWKGPVAAWVDHETASAAEMLAGALEAYGRGTTMGTHTYGKGCVQEYLDDDAQAGVLRLTTLLYALPNGKSVQRTGLTPLIRYPFAANSTETEAKTSHVGPSWSGPDVRPAAHGSYPKWPRFSVSRACENATTCGALAVLGAASERQPRAHAPQRRSP